ncbi:hypothetical protein Salat_0733200 [Sesamum alatum]|uniref:GRF-type domain-containing protein n=1 Tax=Sesamum alatum TaxID=300844 RepID=A0AAE1YT99_9LAMI|nr:hypothetical protein Salat_0733200 [Sesamum alatum]
MNTSSSNPSQSRSTGNSFSYDMEPEDSACVRICKCGNDLTVRTSWTNSNPGRRFRGCSGDTGVYCGVFEWIDPPMCRRAKDVIPDLLNRINNQDRLLKELRQKVVVLEARDGDKVLYRLCGILGSVIIMILFILYQKMFYCQHWTPEIEDTFIHSLLAHHRKGTFHEDRQNCHAVLCALFDINARYGTVEWDPNKNTISADDYVWEQIAKAKTIGKCYVNAPERQWTSLWVLFGECTGDFDDEEESIFFDRAGTCLDDEWVHPNKTLSDSSSENSSDGHSDELGMEDPSWWAFVQEYYASDSGTASVNTYSATIRRPA